MSSGSLPLPVGCPPGCPGCRYRTLPYEEACQQKTQWLQRALAPWHDRLLPLQKAPEPLRWGYRDKVLLHSSFAEEQWQFGLRKRDQIIPIPDCPIHTQRVVATVHLLMDVLPGNTGFALAYLAISAAQVVLILKQKELPDSQWLTPKVQQELARIGIEGLWLHLFPSAGKKVFSKRGWHLLWGKPWSESGNGLAYGPAAFQQLIPSLANASLQQSRDFLQPRPNTKVLDLYCGTGSSLQLWLENGTQCLGVESSAAAIEQAEQNVPEAALLRGSCQQRLPQIQQWHDSTSGTPLLYVNPPRTGLEKEVIIWILQAYKPSRIAYLSCSAGTLARDLNILETDYQVTSITGYDFFPQTHHVETLALLELKA